VLGTLFLSIALSLFLAQTIVRPLRRLAMAAVRVRLGRSREVVVPRLPDRNDEIGMLARAVSDMTQALRERIDATETFAADVAHELKNPLASMASAVESLGKTSDPAITAQLHAILADDVRRLDRSVTDIAELSRLDGEMSRTRFEPVDVVAMLDTIVSARELRRVDGTPPVSFDRPRGQLRIVGDEPRLVRAVENLIDNAISFTPPGAEVGVSAQRTENMVSICVDDSGPGVPPERREAIFRRFHSERPEGDFARHSGLGLAIAETIVQAMGGTIAVEQPPKRTGARFAIRLPGV